VFVAFAKPAQEIPDETGEPEGVGHGYGQSGLRRTKPLHSVEHQSGVAEMLDDISSHDKAELAGDLHFLQPLDVSGNGIGEQSVILEYSEDFCAVIDADDIGHEKTTGSAMYPWRAVHDRLVQRPYYRRIPGGVLAALGPELLTHRPG